MNKVSITVYINKEIKNMLSKRQVSMSSWIRSAINLKIGKEKQENMPEWKKYKLESQRRKRNDFNYNKLQNLKSKEKYKSNKVYREYQKLRTRVYYNINRFNIGDIV